MSTWQEILKNNITSWQELAKLGALTARQLSEISTNSNFPLNIPRRLALKIVPDKDDDPILRQFIPSKDEERLRQDFYSDPLQEESFQATPLLLHKYQGRALILATPCCAMHCRYCFRRHCSPLFRKDFDEEIQYLAKNTSISEVILSGGDPLMLSNQKLEALLHNLALIPHLQRIRLHSRMPIGIPERIDHNLLEILSNLPQQVWMVIHCNHPQELDDDILDALQSLQRAGIPTLNQSVLLKDINDNPQTLAKLHESLINRGILPYYLHQLDRTQGAAHFEVNIKRGLEIIADLQRTSPGYSIPRYVQEIPHYPHKTPLFSEATSSLQ
ncbi:MAG: KamA family radical SAM protein [Chlamydiota bacterium]